MAEKIALVLSGGGFKGAFQLGALKFLRDHWDLIHSDHPKMKFDIVGGVSVGSLNGLLVAMDQFDELERLWEQVGQNGVSEIYTSDFIETAPDQANPNPALKLSLTWDKLKRHFPGTTKNILFRAIFNKKAIMNSLKDEFQEFKSIASNDPLRQKLTRLTRREKIKDCIYTCGYVSLDDGQYYSKRHTDFATDADLVNAILASTAMPIIWRPVESIQTQNPKDEQRNAVDGGIRDVSPLGDVIREIGNQESLDTYTIIVINCSSGEVEDDNFDKKNIAQIALRSLVDIAITEIFNHDIKEFVDKNFILEQIQKKHPEEVIYDYDFGQKKQGKPLRYFNSIIIQPDPNQLGDSLTANKIQIDHRIQHGMDKAKLALEKHKDCSDDYKCTIV
jgi:NTE family protein